MKRIVLSIWFLALVVAIPVIVLLPPVFEKYRIEPVDEGFSKEPNPVFYFEDLNSDGKIEKVILFSKPQEENKVAFQYFDENGAMIDQVNFTAKYYGDFHRLWFADFDEDGNKEIYLISCERDSILLNWVSVFPEVSEIHSLPLCMVTYFGDNKEVDYSIGEFYHLDLENDGRKELVFALNGGYSYSPRQIFKVDIRNRTVERSQNTGSACGPLTFYDLNGDGKLEIISDGQVAPDRDWFNLPYNEPAPYLKVYNADLSFFFPPVKFCEGIQSITQTFVVENGKEPGLLCIFLSHSADCEPFRAYKINLNGEITASMDYPGTDKVRMKFVIQNDKGNFVTQTRPSQLLEFSKDLEIVGTFRLDNDDDISYLAKRDLNGDGKPEYFFQNRNHSDLLVVTDNLKRIYRIPVKGIYSGISGDELFGKANQFYVIAGNAYQVYSFDQNRWYFMKFPGYMLIYLVSALFIWLLQTLRMKQIEEKTKLQNQVHELQLSSLRNQLDPHFIYNTFNTIASVIKQGRNDEGYDLFLLLSKMVRKQLESPDKIYTTLKGELDFVRDYLSIQKFRFKDLFHYEIKVEKNVDTGLQIPKMLIQVHVENALKHGIRSLKTGGLLHIRVSMTDGKVKIEIEDNGIGREKSKQLKTESNGIGLKTIQQIIELNNQKNKNHISQKITDVKDVTGNVAGTLVQIFIGKNN